MQDTKKNAGIKTLKKLRLNRINKKYISLLTRSHDLFFNEFNERFEL